MSYSNAADTDSVSPILSSAWASPSAVTVTDGDDAEVDEVVAMAELKLERRDIHEVSVHVIMSAWAGRCLSLDMSSGFGWREWTKGLWPRF